MRCADRDKLQQILFNLLTNATKFTADGGAIEVDCFADESRVYVNVRDTGVGIPDERLATIFDPFVQVETGYTRSSEGIGLGLAISRELARGMSGALTVASTAGTRIDVHARSSAARSIAFRPETISVEELMSVIRRLAVGALVAPTLVFAQGSRAASAPKVGPPNGTVIVVGGGSMGPEIYSRFIEAAGGPNALIIDVPTAGGDSVYTQDAPGTRGWKAGGREERLRPAHDRPKARRLGQLRDDPRQSGRRLVRGRPPVPSRRLVRRHEDGAGRSTTCWRAAA